MFLDLVHAQEKRGDDVCVVVPPGGVNYKRLASDGVNVIPLNVRSSKFDYHASLKLSGILKKQKINVLNTHLTSAAQLGSAAAHWADVPCVASVLKMTKKNRYMKCDMLTPCSEAVKDDLEKQGVPESMMKRIYTGIDLGRYLKHEDKDKNCRDEFGFSREDKVFGVVARLVPMKGHSYLVQAFSEVASKHPEARLLIVGDGELKQSLENMVAELGVTGKVVFAGTRYDLVKMLNTMDISVLSSVEKEGLPMILVESVLMKKPVVMSDVAGIREVIKDGETGFLIKPGDVGGLAAAMNDVIEKPDEAASRAETAFGFVIREFDVDNTVTQLSEVYEKVLERKSAGA